MSRFALTQDRVYREETLAAHQRSVELSIAIIQERFGDQLSLDDLANSAFMSRYHFTRVFTKTTGVSPGRFLAAIRMQEAKRLLLQSGRSVTDISLNVGYNSLGTFTRIFSDFVGFPPVRFRQLALALRSFPLESVITLLPPPRRVSLNAPISGEVYCDSKVKLAVVGLFPTTIPRSRPSECVVLQETTEFAFCRIPRHGGRVHAAGLLPGATLEDAILATTGRIVVGSGALAHNSPNSRCVAVKLRNRRVIEPPLLVAFPLLIAESLLSKQMGNLREVY